MAAKNLGGRILVGFILNILKSMYLNQIGMYSAKAAIVPYHKPSRMSLPCHIAEGTTQQVIIVGLILM
jgi:hypothetical protein